MKKQIPFTLGDGKTQVYFDVEIPSGRGGYELAGRIDDATERAGRAFETALLKVRGTAETIAKNLKEMMIPPNEIEVTFGVKLTLEADVVIVSGTSEANFSVTLKWKKKD